MSFKIESGLFLLDFTDCHAILGVPIDANLKEIRKRYLVIARRLHPDTCTAKSSTDKQWANQLLSQLVNPAYEKLSHERSYAEYMVTLREMSKRLAQEADGIPLKSELSLQLKQSQDIDLAYEKAIAQAAKTQYESFEQVIAAIAQISELNLIYLMRKAGTGLKASASESATAVIPSKSAPTPTPSSPAPEPELATSAVEPYLRRAQALLEQNLFAPARVELQDALKLAPNHSRCHSLIGTVYLKQNQATMAKVHINKALQLDPKDPIAIAGKQQLDRLAGTASSQANTSHKTATKKASEPSQSGGLFGGLFGGKKK